MRKITGIPVRPIGARVAPVGDDVEVTRREASRIAVARFDPTRLIPEPIPAPLAAVTPTTLGRP